MTIVIAVLVTLALAALLVLRHDAVARVVGVEAYKILLQFILVAVLGGAVSLIYQAFNRDADQRAQDVRRAEDLILARREARQRYLRDLVEQYNAVKRARRMLRAQALVRRPGNENAPRLRAGRYDEFLQVVLDAQLSLEAHSFAVRADNELFPERGQLAMAISRAETYLRELVTEYEETMPTLEDEQALVELSALPLVASFIGPYGQAADFRERFVAPMQQALSTIQRLLLT
ncbi:hypothetical protein ABZU25_06065 [Micromonospora sp. NPDC005215]|uniref:hypothetical protein n=1 Tax=Micromonospora sp. NPDC005215 TaxID=3157024 RepID=UPI0033AA33E9